MRVFIVVGGMWNGNVPIIRGFDDSTVKDLTVKVTD
jgi:hypothetical protein